MPKIVIDVDSNKLSKVMNILENLQPELIQGISLEKSNVKPAKPISSSLDKIETRAAQPVNTNKYLSSASYKKKIQKQPILEDEFLATKTSTGKYLNANDYKNRLNK